MAKTVLIVDDSAFMRMLLKKILTKNGYEVVGEAESGEEAIELYKEKRPDICLVDIIMPGMNGIEAVRKIKEIDPDAKIIMCSSVGQQSMVTDAISAGAKGFITKPFKESKVIEEIQKLE